jgi:hypothetical protein
MAAKSKTLKWWRAMCAFRDLPKPGEEEDLQRRLKSFLEAEEKKREFTMFLAIERAAVAKLKETSDRQVAEWDALTAEEKLAKDPMLFIRGEFNEGNQGYDDEPMMYDRSVRYLMRTKHSGSKVTDSVKRLGNKSKTFFIVPRRMMRRSCVPHQHIDRRGMSAAK